MAGASARHDDVLAMIEGAQPATAAAALMLMACLRPAASVGADALTRSSALRDKLGRDPHSDADAHAVAAITTAIVVRSMATATPSPGRGRAQARRAAGSAPSLL